MCRHLRACSENDSVLLQLADSLIELGGPAKFWDCVVALRKMEVSGRGVTLDKNKGGEGGEGHTLLSG